MPEAIGALEEWMDDGCVYEEEKDDDDDDDSISAAEIERRPGDFAIYEADLDSDRSSYGREQ